MSWHADLEFRGGGAQVWGARASDHRAAGGHRPRGRCGQAAQARIRGVREVRRRLRGGVLLSAHFLLCPRLQSSLRCRSLSFLFLFAQRPCCAKVLSARAELYAEQQRSIARKISDFDKEVRDPPEPHTSISDRVRVRCTGRCVPSSLVFRGTNVGRGGQGQVRRKDALPRAQTR